MKCIVSGGTGFIGHQIVARLRQDRHDVDVWSRHASAPYQWDPVAGPPSIESVGKQDVVIHLAGEPVAQRWNEEVKRRIFDSRVLGTRHLVDVIALVTDKPKLLICASAIGIYGDRGDEILTESSPLGEGFLADACRGWEAEADRATEFGLRVVKLRIGIVLGKGGGALARMLPAFKLCAGGRLGSGKQWMPWVHVDDVTDMVAYAIKSDAVAGVLNATSPNPVRNADFTRALARAVHRPAILPIPPLALKLAFGELGRHMLDSARVIPEAAMQAGFRFCHPELHAALRDLLE